MDPQEKAAIFADYHSTLCTLDIPDREASVNFIRLINLANGRQEHQVILDSPIGIGEVIDAIGGFKRNTSAGVDGFTGEFYLKN